MSARKKLQRQQVALDILRASYDATVPFPSANQLRSKLMSASPGRRLLDYAREKSARPGLSMDDLRISRADDARLMAEVEEWLASYAKMEGGVARPVKGSLAMRRALFFWGMGSGPVVDLEGVIQPGVVHVRKVRAARS